MRPHPRLISKTPEPELGWVKERCLYIYMVKVSFMHANIFITLLDIYFIVEFIIMMRNTCAVSCCVVLCDEMIIYFLIFSIFPSIFYTTIACGDHFDLCWIGFKYFQDRRWDNLEFVYMLRVKF